MPNGFLENWKNSDYYFTARASLTLFKINSSQMNYFQCTLPFEKCTLQLNFKSVTNCKLCWQTIITGLKLKSMPQIKCEFTLKG